MPRPAREATARPVLRSSREISYAGGRMPEFDFKSQRQCPACKATFVKAPLRPEFEPVVIVACPSCQKLLGRPGSDESAALVVYDPNADAGGI